MIIMALDHVRDYFHVDAMTDDPTNLATTTPFLFFTRWITHFCAPTFVFLSGVSAFLSGQRRTKKDLSIFFVDTWFMANLNRSDTDNFWLAFRPRLSFTDHAGNMGNRFINDCTFCINLSSVKDDIAFRYRPNCPAQPA